jgi:hypothetical protein
LVVAMMQREPILGQTKTEETQPEQARQIHEGPAIGLRDGYSIREYIAEEETGLTTEETTHSG